MKLMIYLCTVLSLFITFADNADASFLKPKIKCPANNAILLSLKERNECHGGVCIHVQDDETKDPKPDPLLVKIYEQGSPSDLVCYFRDYDPDEALEILNKPIENYYFYPLMIAAKHNNIELVRYLIASGVDSNAVTKGGDWTALRLASEHNNVKVVEYLIP